MFWDDKILEITVEEISRQVEKMLQKRSARLEIWKAIGKDRTERDKTIFWAHHTQGHSKR